MRMTPLAIWAVLFCETFGAMGQPSVEDLQRQVQELADEVARLRAEREREIVSRVYEDGAVADAVLRDVERRENLLSDSGTLAAGHDEGGFFIRSGEAWVLRPGLQFQFRGVLNDRQGSGDDRGGWDSGFEIRRLRLTFEGNAFSKDFSYKFQWSTRTTDGQPRLTDAWVEYAMSELWSLRLGQFKDPVHHEELLTSRNLLAAERSLVNEAIGGGINGRTQGVSLGYGNGSPASPVNLDIAIHDGAGQANTGFEKGPFDFGVSARAEWKFLGSSWAPYRDFSARNNKSDLGVMGAAISWSQGGDSDLITATADVQWENTRGLGLYGAVLLPQVNGPPDFGLPQDSTWGALLQTAYVLNNAWEVFGRGDLVAFPEPVEGPGGAEDLFWELTVGVNHFLGRDGSAGHRAKITFDVSYLPQGVPADLVSPSTLGATGQAGDEQWIVRLQFQLVI
jgi:hypothetical protein